MYQLPSDQWPSVHKSATAFTSKRVVRQHSETERRKMNAVNETIRLVTTLVLVVVLIQVCVRLCGAYLIYLLLCLRRRLFSGFAPSPTLSCTPSTRRRWRVSRTCRRHASTRCPRRCRFLHLPSTHPPQLQSHKERRLRCVHLRRPSVLACLLACFFFFTKLYREKSPSSNHFPHRLFLLVSPWPTFHEIRRDRDLPPPPTTPTPPPLPSFAHARHQSILGGFAESPAVIGVVHTQTDIPSLPPPPSSTPHEVKPCYGQMDLPNQELAFPGGGGGGGAEGDRGGEGVGVTIPDSRGGRVGGGGNGNVPRYLFALKYKEVSFVREVETVARLTRECETERERERERFGWRGK